MYEVEETSKDSDKSIHYYIDYLNATNSLTLKQSMMEYLARKINGGASPLAQLKDVLGELRVQCSCQPIG